MRSAQQRRSDRYLQDLIEDNRRLAFLKRLDAAPFQIPDTEAALVKQWISRQQHPLFSLAEQQQIETLQQKYALQLP